MAQQQPSPFDLQSLFGDLFGQFFGGRSQHLSVDVALTDAEAAAGVTREVQVQRIHQCTTCTGRGSADPNAVATPCTACSGIGRRTHTQGFFQVQSTCAECKGTGTLLSAPCRDCRGAGTTTAPEALTITVPAGCAHQQVLLIAGKGSTLRDGATGDLYVHLLVGGRPDARLTAVADLGPDAASPFAAPLPEARLHGPRPARRIPWGLIVSMVIVLVGFALLSR